MHEEIWKKWIPKENLSGKYYIKKICDEEELKIELIDDNNRNVSVIWKSIVESYTCSEEVNRNKLYNDANLTKWTFFEVINSRYIAWLLEESEGILEEKRLHHICLVGGNSVVDVISWDYPEIIFK